MSFLQNIFGKGGKEEPDPKQIKKLQAIVDKISVLEETFKGFSDEQLKAKTKEFKERLKNKETLDHILPEAFGIVRETAKRKLGQRHYDSQIMGGIVIHQGNIAEMKTGEGKTLAATLPSYLNGLAGQGVHIITVNDYLAKRDAVWMGQIHYALGLSVGCVVHEKAFVYDPDYQVDENQSQAEEERDKERDETGSFKVEESYLRPVERRQAYAADITYGTNHEFGFDYLRDNMVAQKEQKVQRKFNYTIIDEIDSILIDEARTPLIISQPDFESSKLYKEFSRIVPKLNSETDYETDEKMKTATLTEQGIDRIEKILGLSNIYEEKGVKYLHYLEQSLRAATFFRKDKNYIIKHGEVIIIDEFTGRLMPGRRYSGGLHQAIEAREGVEVQPESKILATITFQNYFRMYSKVSGMTGTALTSSEEFEKVYGLEVVVVPTNKPLIRQSLADQIYKTEQAKFNAAVKAIKKRQEKGQPVLVGTRSVERNEYLAKLLDREGVRYEILNAKNHNREAQIIAQAGKKGAVTVATNMAGRGVDIILGGNPPDKAEAEEVKQLGGLHVIGTERHEARRIDNQLRGRAGRQGDAGSSQFFVSVDDELLRIFGGERIRKVMNMLKIEDDQPIEARMISKALEKAQTRVEGLNFDARSHVLEYDNVIAKHRMKIYTQRDQILEGDYQTLQGLLMKTLGEEIQGIVSAHFLDGVEGKEKIINEMKTIMPLPVDAFVQLKELTEAEQVTEYLTNLAGQALTEKATKETEESLEKVIRFALLKTMDMFWTEHLVNLDHLKDAVKLRAYGGKDPLIEYKSEGHRMFQQLWDSINFQISRTIFKLSVNN